MTLTPFLIALSLAQTTPAADPAAAAAQPAPAPVKAAPTLAGALANAPKPTFWGFVNAQYSRTEGLNGADDTSTFELRRARIGARGKVHELVGYSILFDGADSKLKDGYVSLFALPGVEVRMGQWKTPFGYEQYESDTKLLWVNTSYVVGALARGPDARDLGAGLLVQTPKVGPVSAEVLGSFVNGAGPNKKDDLETKNFWGRAGLTLKQGTITLKAGGSYGTGQQVQGTGGNGAFDGVGTPVDDTYFYFHTYGVDATLDTPWLFAAAELIQSERDQSRYATAAAVTTVTRSSRTARGWYAGAYGKTPWNLGPIFRAERFDADRTAPGGRLERYTIGAYVDVIPVNARLILNHELDQGQTGAAGRTGDRTTLFAQVIF